MRYRTQLLVIAGVVGFLGYALMTSKPDGSIPAQMSNAQLDAEIQSALAKDGVYTPPNALQVDYRARALILCQRYAKAAARHPSTVSGWGSKVQVGPDNTAIVAGTFRAKNSFGLELNHEIACHVAPDGTLTASISENG